MDERPEPTGSHEDPGDGSEALSQFHAVAGAVSDAVGQLDADGRFVAVSDDLLERTGYAREELLGAHVSALFDDETAALLESDDGASAEAGSVTAVEGTLRTASGRPVGCELRRAPITVDGTGGSSVLAVSASPDRPGEPPVPQDTYEAIAGVLDEADVGVFVLDSEFEVAWINETTEEYFDLERTDVLGRNKRRLIDEAIRDVVVEPASFADTVLSTYEDNSHVTRFECRLRPEGGTERWVEHRSRPITTGRYAGGRIELYYDITERKRSERHLNEREQQLASIIDAVSEYAIFMLEPDGTVATWNEGARRIKGYDAEEIIGEHFSTFYTDGDTEDGTPTRNLATAARSGSIEDEGWRVRKDGTRFWADVVITAIHGEDGSLEGFAKVTRDLTGRREYEEQLKRERDQTQQLLETSPIAISVRDGDGTLLTTNERAQELLGLSEREIAEQPDDIDEWTVFDADGEPITPDQRPWARVRETGERVVDEEFGLERPSGERTWLSVNAAPLFGPDGELDRIITAAEDITVLKEHERELETELSEILGRVSDAFYALDREFRFTHVNDRAEKLLQHTEEELLGECLWDVFPEAADQEAVWDSFHTALETQEQTSYELYFSPLGFWVEANIYPSETGVSVYFRDVSDRIERERELEASERRYRTLAEQFPNGIVALYDDDLTFTLAAGRAFEKLEYDACDLEGERLETAFDDVADVLEPVYRDALAGEPQSIEIEHADRQWLIHTTPVTDEHGEPFAGMVMSQDITERKEREQKLENFASVVSHGLRNPLGIAQVYLNMAREDGDPESFEQVEQALDRMETIIDNLLTTALEGRTVSEPAPISLAATVEAAWQNVETADATLEVTATDTILADGDQLQSALENVLRNAISYGGDDVEVRVGPLEGGFYVEDSGPGIPPEDRTDVFEYGYSSQSGTGIGLAVVRDIVEAHGWTVSVTEGSDGGARFEIRGVERHDASDGDGERSD
ncbi:PAS domain-containing sensor histidine kinase [Natrononativus amylolyticus]|uniref:PAS domain-containing sensor histidine kinase n=1 Tax=Natrononativus amylolyticus TaxID=2963434 RepID=UPI0020CE8735|nr:PAS domain S-box protein [Natrononativus amylolyticus]